MTVSACNTDNHLIATFFKKKNYYYINKHKNSFLCFCSHVSVQNKYKNRSSHYHIKILKITFSARKIQGEGV